MLGVLPGALCARVDEAVTGGAGHDDVAAEGVAVDDAAQSWGSVKVLVHLEKLSWMRYPRSSLLAFGEDVEQQPGAVPARGSRGRAGSDRTAASAARPGRCLRERRDQNV